MPLVEDNKKIVEQNRATNQIILDGLQFRFDALKTQNKVTDLESIEKILELQLDLAVIDEKKKGRCILETEKKEKFKQELTKLQAELTTLKSKPRWYVLMDLGNWYTIRESFKTQWKEPKIKVR
jgi:exonuclease SbcC